MTIETIIPLPPDYASRLLGWWNAMWERGLLSWRRERQVAEYQAEDSGLVYNWCLLVPQLQYPSILEPRGSTCKLNFLEIRLCSFRAGSWWQRKDYGLDLGCAWSRSFQSCSSFSSYEEWRGLVIQRGSDEWIGVKVLQHTRKYATLSLTWAL